MIWLCRESRFLGRFLFLVKDGFIDKQRNPERRNATIHSLTQKGSDLLLDQESKVVEDLRGRLSVLDGPKKKLSSGHRERRH